VSHDVYTLPEGLPVPTDDGAADHLIGLELPDLVLESSEGEVNLRDLDVIYVYPRSGRPEQRIGVLRNPVISWQDAHGQPAPPRVRW